MRVRSAADQAIVTSVMHHDEYQLQRMLPATYIVDIGAHIGAFTVHAKRIWPGAFVLAVEPAADSAQLFRVNTAALDDVSLVECAVGAVEGRAVLYAPLDLNPAARSLTGGLPFQEVPLRRLSKLLNERGYVHVDILKLDCEGSESDILRDLYASGWQQRIRTIVGEWHGKSRLGPILEQLSSSHHVECHVHCWDWGSFLARRA